MSSTFTLTGSWDSVHPEFRGCATTKDEENGCRNVDGGLLILQVNEQKIMYSEVKKSPKNMSLKFVLNLLVYCK